MQKRQKEIITLTLKKTKLTGDCFFNINFFDKAIDVEYEKTSTNNNKYPNWKTALGL